jgi:type IV secretion system protein VirD4
MKNYAGHRLAPWLGHLMVSRQETARALLTPGEIMQLPPDDEIVMLSGCPPIKAKKVRYYKDRAFTVRVLQPPRIDQQTQGEHPNDPWSGLPPIIVATKQKSANITDEDPDNGGIRREPDLPEHEAIAAESELPAQSEFAGFLDETDDDAARQKQMQRRMARVARQAALDPNDGIVL